jgi:hypothetical protein
MIRFRCPCGKVLRAEERFAGEEITCPACGEDVRIPTEEGVAAGEPRAPASSRRQEPAATPRRRRRAEDEDRDWDAPGPAGGKAVLGLILGLLAVSATVVLVLLDVLLKNRTLGVIALVCAAVLGIPAIVLGLLGLAARNRGRRRHGRKGPAVTGLLTGGLSLLLAPLVFLLPGGASTETTQAPPAAPSPALGIETLVAAPQSQNNLKQIALAMHGYLDTYQRFPPAAVYDKEGRPLCSWRVLLLPYLEEGPMYNQFHLNEAWDSPHNVQFVKRIPKVYAHPLNREALAQGVTNYQVFVGTDSDINVPRPIFRRPGHRGDLEPLQLGQEMFQPGFRVGIGQIVDGMSNTILAAEAASAVPWTAPQDLEYSAKGPLPKLGGLFPDRYHVAMADGATLVIHPGRISEETLRHAITMNDGMLLGKDWPGFGGP